MYLLICEGIPYFIYKERDSLEDFVGMADEIYIENNESSAIRRHLLLQLGIIN